eukprot:jgi/Chlat1/4490/Chrsp29S04427
MRGADCLAPSCQIVLAVALLSALLPNAGVKKYFVQRLDHFSNAKATFRQKYYVDETHWNPVTGPVFLQIGGEGPLGGVGGGFIEVLAEKHQAMMVTLEHRFYGESVPGHDFSVDNLMYLNTQQALADIAVFIDYFNGMLLKNVTWFTFGGSYAGALSAWFRLKYPDYTAGSLSSSGVVNAILEYTDFDRQALDFNAVFRAAGLTCGKALQRITAAFEAAIAEGQGEAVKGLLGAADLSTADFFYMLADSAAMAIQYSQKATLCNYLEEHGAFLRNATREILVTAFASFTNTFWGASFGKSCFYDTNCLMTDRKRWQPSARSWRWQKCSQLAYFQTAPKRNSVRSNVVDLVYHFKQCTDIFGKDATPNTRQTNQACTHGSKHSASEYGGATPNGTNIFFTDFSDDPWQWASVTKSPGAHEPYCFVECDNCGHCMDLHAPQLQDPPQLTHCRQQFETHLARWLSEKSQNSFKS